MEDWGGGRQCTQVCANRRLLLYAASGEAEAVQYGDSFILMILLTSAKQRSGSDLSYHSGEKGRS